MAKQGCGAWYRTGTRKGGWLTGEGYLGIERSGVHVGERRGAAGARVALTRGVGGWVPVGGAAPGLSGWQLCLREQQHHPGAKPPRLRLTDTQTLPLPPAAPNWRQPCLRAASPAAAAPAPAPPPPRAPSPRRRDRSAEPGASPRPLAAPAAPLPARPRRPRLGCGRRPGSPEPR